MSDSSFSWQAHEHRARARQPDWYWIIGIFAVSLALASIFFGNILFAVVIITGAVALGVTTARKDEIHSFALTDRGVLVNTTLYPYENIVSFSILEYIDPEIPPTLSLKTKSVFAPLLVIPLTEVDAFEVYEVLSSCVNQESHEDNLLDRIVDFLGF